MTAGEFIIAAFCVSFFVVIAISLFRAFTPVDPYVVEYDSPLTRSADDFLEEPDEP